MPTRSEIYWRQRINQEMVWHLNRSYEHQREVEMIYRDTIDYVIEDINAFFQRYGEREGISRREVVKTVKQTDLNLLANRVREYVENEDFSPEANAMLKEYNLTGRANRAALLKQKIDLATHQLGNKEEKLVGSKLSEEITHQMEVAAGIWGMSVPEVDSLRSMATAIENKPFKGGVWSERLWDRQDALAKHLSGIVDKIILKGQNSTTMINEVRQAFNTSAYVAKRLLVTETARVQSEAQKELMLYNEFEEYRFLAEPTACEHCAALNEQVFKVKDMQPGVNCSPIHPNCRCSSAPEYSEVIEVMSEPPQPSPYDFMDIHIDMNHEEMVSVFKTINKRVMEVIDEYKNATGVDVLELHRERKFTDMWNPYNDERSKFVKYALEKVGYDRLPYRISNTDGYTKLYRGVKSLDDGSITAEDFERRFRDGEMDISGSQTSFYGRGIYFANEEGEAELYAGDDGIVTRAYINLDDVNVLNQRIVENSDYQFNKAVSKEPELRKEAEAYEFLTGQFNMRDSYRDLYAIFHGYDVFENNGYYTIFNRTKVGVEE